MGQGILLLVGGVALYAFAGSALSGQLRRRAKDGSRRRLLLLPAALLGPLALAGAGYGAVTLYRLLALEEYGLPLAPLTAASLAVVGLLAGGLLLLAAAAPPGRGGGSGPDDLPPPPDPEGPDGWAAFEREFRSYAAARDAQRVRVHALS